MTELWEEGDAVEDGIAITISHLSFSKIVRIGFLELGGGDAGLVVDFREQLAESELVVECEDERDIVGGLEDAVALSRVLVVGVKDSDEDSLPMETTPSFCRTGGVGARP